MPLTRRSLLKSFATLPAGEMVGGETASLAEAAAVRGILFGSEVTAADLVTSPAYATLLGEQCAAITPGIEAKFGVVHPAQGRYEFTALDRIVDFAGRSRLALRMHALLWGVGIPAWASEALKGANAGEVLTSHIQSVVGRYCGRVLAWDVVNEAADPRWPSGVEGWCNTAWRQAIGPDYVRLAFAAAHAADPMATLCLNDDDLEYAGPAFTQKRETYIRLLDNLLAKNVPISGFGLEAHLKPWLPFDEQGYMWFLRRLAERNLTILITELDVCDRDFPSDFSERDAATARVVGHYLNVALVEPGVRAVFTWGLSDAFSSQSKEPIARRYDGLPPRPLPFGPELLPKPMHTALVTAFRNAPPRPALIPHRHHGGSAITSPATRPP